MTAHGIISADSHMTEPMDLWQERLDRRFRSRAPKVVNGPRSGTKPTAMFVAEGAPPMPVAGGFAAGRSGEELAEFMAKGYEAARPSGWDPVERIKDQDLDGIGAEILYPTLSMQLFLIPDGELQRACFGVYNDWLAEFCAHDPRRLNGVGLISLEDIDHAVADVAQLAKQGMHGAMIWCSPPADRGYGDRAYDRFWAAASEHRLPLTLHPITGRGPKAVNVAEFGNTSHNHGVTSTTAFHEVQETIATLIFEGVLERFPNLRFVSAESDVGWFPHLLHRMDHFYDRLEAMLPTRLSERPSFYARRQIWATFQDDPVGPATHQLFGEDNYMWASDFPHSDSTFPDSRGWIEKNFRDVPDAVREKMVRTNVATLYGIKL